MKQHRFIYCFNFFSRLVVVFVDALRRMKMNTRLKLLQVKRSCPHQFLCGTAVFLSITMSPIFDFIFHREFSTFSLYGVYKSQITNTIYTVLIVYQIRRFTFIKLVSITRRYGTAVSLEICP